MIVASHAADAPVGIKAAHATIKDTFRVASFRLQVMIFSSQKSPLLKWTATFARTRSTPAAPITRESQEWLTSGEKISKAAPEAFSPLTDDFAGQPAYCNN